jgi:hypothetical protein
MTSLNELSTADLTEIKFVLHYIQDASARQRTSQVVGNEIRQRQQRPAFTFMPDPDGGDQWIIGQAGSARRHKPTRQLKALWPLYIALSDHGFAVRTADFADPAATAPDESLRKALGNAADWIESLGYPRLAAEMRTPRCVITDGSLRYQPGRHSPVINPG